MRSALIIATVAQVALAGLHVIDGDFPVAIVLAFCAITTGQYSSTDAPFAAAHFTTCR